MTTFSEMNLLVPTDFSVNSIQAIRAELRLTGSGQNVIALHVVEPISDAMIAGELPSEFQVDKSEESRRDIRKNRLAGFLEEHDCGDVSVEVCTGDPALCIARFAKERSIDMIVMLTNGSPHRGYNALSPVTERVLCNTGSPVLVLPCEDEIESSTPARSVENCSRGVAAAPN